MMIQNWKVLDQLTAASGGVCVMEGNACCTYIPENDEDGHTIDTGIQDLNKFIKNVQEWQTASDDWLAELFPGVKAWIIRLLAPVVIVLYLLMLIACCVIPCVRAMIDSTVKKMFGQYVKLPQEEGYKMMLYANGYVWAERVKQSFV